MDNLYIENNIIRIPLNGIFIVWGALQGSRRSEQIAQKLNIGIEYVFITTKRGLFYAPIKYVYQAIATLKILIKKRPDIIFIQNPPPFAAFFVFLYCLFFGSKFIIDTHTGALIYPQWRLTLPLQRFLSKRALTTILTNTYLSQIVRSWGAESFVLEDPPLTIKIKNKPTTNKEKFQVVMICRGDPDEPVKEVIEVARNLRDFEFYITGDFGNFPNFRDIKRNATANVYFTGFLRDDFFSLLNEVDVILCLTKDNHTFQSGANEALWVGKPLVTSDWPILKRYFNKGTVHVSNTINSIQKGLQEIQRNYSDYQHGIKALQAERRKDWQEKANALLNLIQQK